VHVSFQTVIGTLAFRIGNTIQAHTRLQLRGLLGYFALVYALLACKGLVPGQNQQPHRKHELRATKGEITSDRLAGKFLLSIFKSTFGPALRKALITVLCESTTWAPFTESRRSCTFTPATSAGLPGSTRVTYMPCTSSAYGRLSISLLLDCAHVTNRDRWWGYEKLICKNNFKFEQPHEPWVVLWQACEAKEKIRKPWLIFDAHPSANAATDAQPQSFRHTDTDAIYSVRGRPRW